jgi:hypothetical protein
MKRRTNLRDWTQIGNLLCRAWLIEGPAHCLGEIRDVEGLSEEWQSQRARGRFTFRCGAQDDRHRRSSTKAAHFLENIDAVHLARETQIENQQIGGPPLPAGQGLSAVAGHVNVPGLGPRDLGNRIRDVGIVFNEQEPGPHTPECIRVGTVGRRPSVEIGSRSATRSSRKAPKQTHVRTLLARARGNGGTMQPPYISPRACNGVVQVLTRIPDPCDSGIRRTRSYRRCPHRHLVRQTI